MVAALNAPTRADGASRDPLSVRGELTAGRIHERSLRPQYVAQLHETAVAQALRRGPFAAPQPFRRGVLFPEIPQNATPFAFCGISSPSCYRDRSFFPGFPRQTGHIGWSQSVADCACDLPANCRSFPSCHVPAKGCVGAPKRMGDRETLQSGRTRGSRLALAKVFGQPVHRRPSHLLLRPPQGLAPLTRGVPAEGFCQEIF